MLFSQIQVDFYAKAEVKFLTHRTCPVEIKSLLHMLNIELSRTGRACPAYG